MICPNGHQMHKEDVLTHRTTSPDESDTYETMWVCDKCDTVIDPVTEEVL